MAVKTRRARRRVVITRDLARKLIAHKLLAVRSGDEAFVFTARTGAPCNHCTVGRAFARAVNDAGIGDACAFHWLRHPHGSQLIAAGWDIAAVAARLGDAIATVQATYVHEFDAVRRAHAQREQLAAMTADGSATRYRASPPSRGRGSETAL